MRSLLPNSEASHVPRADHSKELQVPDEDVRVGVPGAEPVPDVFLFSIVVPDVFLVSFRVSAVF